MNAVKALVGSQYSIAIRLLSMPIIKSDVRIPIQSSIYNTEIDQSAARIRIELIINVDAQSIIFWKCILMICFSHLPLADVSSRYVYEYTMCPAIGCVYDH